MRNYSTGGILLATFVVASSASAQIYKCGNSFSQMPCGPDAKVIAAPAHKDSPLPIPPDLPAAPDVVAKAKASCEQAVRQRMKDPESARIKDVRRGETASWCRHGPEPVRYYWMTVNAKNSYGGYVGEQSYRCAMDINEQTVLGVAQLAPGEALPARCH